MFDAIRNNQKLIQILLGLIILPFVFSFGLDYYTRGSSVADDAAAEVAGVKITNREVDRAVAQRKLELRQQLGEAYNEAFFDQPQVRESIVESLVMERALQLSAVKSHLVVPDVVLQDLLKGVPEFQENGKFSQSKYAAVLARYGESELGYEQRRRELFARGMLLAPVAEAPVISKTVVERVAALRQETRTVSAWHFDNKTYLPEIKLAANAAKEQYDAHKDQYRAPERIKVEYVVLDAETIAKQTKVDEKDIRKYYDDNLAQFSEPEERKPLQILISVDEKADKATRQAARAKADEALKLARANPAGFEALIQQFSPESAEFGLDFVARGGLEKVLDEALFKLKLGEVSGVLETNFGFHILKFSEVRGGKAKPFEAARVQIVDELTRAALNKRYSEAVEQFGNLAYEQADTFKGITEKLGFVAQKSDWIERGKPAAVAVLNNARLQKALFSEDSLKNRRNTESIDVGGGSYVAARVVEHAPAAQRPFEEVKAQIEQDLRLEQAKEMAADKGQQHLAELKDGKAQSDAAWGPAQVFKRESKELPPEARGPLFGMEAKTTPAYVGLSSENGYTIYRLDKVDQPKALDADTLEKERFALLSILGEQDKRSFVMGLRQRLGVKMSAVSKVADEAAED